MHRLTLNFSPISTVEREMRSYSGVIDYDLPGVSQGVNNGFRPFYKFNIVAGPLSKAQADSLSAVYGLLQGGIPFLWDGGPFGAVNDYHVIGVGDGATRTFAVPNRQIGSGSFSAQTRNNTADTTSVWGTLQASLTPVAGTVTFSEAPVFGHDVMAQWACQYLVYFPKDGITIQTANAETSFAQITLRESVLPGVLSGE